MNYKDRIITFGMSAALAVMLSLTFGITLQGCALNPATGHYVVVKPQTPMQSIYALEVSLTTAVNALADAHGKGYVVGANYDKAVAIAKQAQATLLDARAAATAKEASKLQVALVTLASLIDGIAVYNGGIR